MSGFDTDVLIVGAGPTGLMLALELALHKTPFRIIDSVAVRSPQSRALVLHPRSLELLHRHGVLDAIIAKGRFNSTVRMFCNQRQVVQIELKDLPFQDTSFPLPLMISQADTERILEEKILTYGVEVERPVAAERMEQDDSGVTAWVRKGNGSEMSIRAKFAVGCDGSHSIVRKSAGLKFEGAAYAQDFILADVKMQWEMADCLHIFIGSQGFLVAFPVPMQEGLWRLICSRPLGVDKEAEPIMEDFREVVGRFVPGTTELSDPVWITKFALHHRIVDNYRAGRLFVAGDAAHIHSPAGGQGMNTGIQDAANLGWKLATVLKSSEDKLGLLDSYNDERYPVGQKLLQGTDRMFELMATTNPILLWLRNTLFPWIMPLVMRSPQRRANRFRFVSQLGIRYRRSPVVGQAENWVGRVKGGDRAGNSKLVDVSGEETTFLDLCIKPTGHHLFLFAGETEPADLTALEEAGRAFDSDDGQSEWGVHYVVLTKLVNGDGKESYTDPDAKLHRWYGFTEAGYVLVRPDGHVEFIGSLAEIDDLKAWRKK